MEHPNAKLIRELYDARARDDVDTIRSILADDIVWHDPGNNPPFTGDLQGVDAVLRMIDKAKELTDRTFRLWLHAVVANDEHAVALVNWSAERGGKTISGREVGVYHVRDGKVAEVWFHPADPKALEEFWAQ